MPFLRLDYKKLVSIMTSPPLSLALREVSSHIIRTYRHPVEKPTCWGTEACTNTQVSLEANSSATVGPGPEMTAAPANNLTATLWNRLSQNHSSKLFLDSQPLKGMQDNKCLFWALCFKIICSTAIINTMKQP